MNLTELCIRRPIIGWVMLIAFVLAGGLALQRIGVGMLPDLDRPTLSVQANWQGASADNIERQVAVPLEEAIAQVEGVRRIESQVSRGSVRITVTLALSRDVNATLQEVQSKVAAASRRLPRDLDTPQISKSNPDDDPVMRVAIAGERRMDELTDLARSQVMEALQSVPGVGELSLNSSVRTLRVWLDVERLNRLGITAGDVQQAIARQHREDPAGSLINGSRESALRIYGEAATLAQLGELPIDTRTASDGSRTTIRLRDVASFENGFDDNARIVRVNGKPAIMLEIRKARGADSVAVVDRVRAELQRIESGLSSGLTVTVINDFTGFIRESLSHLAIEIALAILLTSVVCRVALGSWAAAFNVMLAIPMSLLGSVAVLWMAGMTLNTFTLLGMALAVGLVVDDSIMVQEAIARRRALGEDGPTAANRGTSEVKLAAAASTAAILAVFIPVLAMDGELGRSFAQFGLAMCVAVALSYLEAITLTPARSAWMRHRVGAHAEPTHDTSFMARFSAAAMRKPITTLSVGLGLSVLLSSALLALPRELIPPQDQGFVGVRFIPPSGAGIETQERNATLIEQAVASHPAVAVSFVSYDAGSGFCGAVLRRDRRETQDQVVAALRSAVSPIVLTSRLEVFGRKESLGTQTGFRGGDADVVLSGADWQRLLAVGRRVEMAARSATGVASVWKDVAEPSPELAVLPDAQACARLGLSVETVSRSVAALIGGVNVAQFSVGDQRLDLRIRVRADQRMTPDQVGAILLRTPSGAFVPVRSVAAIEDRAVRNTFMRLDRSRAMTITASATTGMNAIELQESLDALARTISQGEGLRVLQGQTAIARNEVGHGLVLAFVLGLVAAYLILAMQFDSWKDPLIVLMILPLSTGGAAAALWLAGASLNAITGIGLLLLLGLAKKNSILLVDCANALLRDGATPIQAARGAIARRLRPILMTSVATIAGALPIAIGFGPGAELRQPMAIAIIGGIALSTTIALFAIPALWLLTTRRTSTPTPP